MLGVTSDHETRHNTGYWFVARSNFGCRRSVADDALSVELLATKNPLNKIETPQSKVIANARS